MDAKTTYAENATLEANLRAGNRYMKLHVGDPGEEATSNPAGETTRKQITFDAAAGGVCASNSIPKWTLVSTTETYSHWSLWDAATGGNPFYKGSLAAPSSQNAGDNFELSTVTISEN